MSTENTDSQRFVSDELASLITATLEGTEVDWPARIVIDTVGIGR